MAGVIKEQTLTVVQVNVFCANCGQELHYVDKENWQGEWHRYACYDCRDFDKHYDKKYPRIEFRNVVTGEVVKVLD